MIDPQKIYNTLQAAATARKEYTVMKFEEAKLEVIEFEEKDIIATSDNSMQDDGNNPDDPEEE